MIPLHVTKNFRAMFSSVIIAAIFGVISIPNSIQGQNCRRTNPDPNKNCPAECLVRLGCTRRRECICDGDCGHSCVKKGLTCKSPKPSSLNNGFRDVKGRKFNDTVVFTCRPGFTLSGSSVRTCRGLGTWDGIEPKCGKNCPDPGTGNKNTMRREPVRNKGFTTSQKLHYSCAPGHHIEGKSSITCQENGSWDDNVPQCYQTSCPPPKLPPYSVVFKPAWFNISQGARHGMALFLTCDSGYHKIGTGAMKCDGDQWKIQSSFRCNPVNCGDPGTPMNGAKKGLNYQFKSKVTFHCDKCHKLIGAAYRICNADQTWSDQQPTCQRDATPCKAIQSIPNGQVSTTSVDCGGQATFSCSRGYNLVGSRKIFCIVGGQWSAITPRCEPVTCKLFRLPEHVEIQYVAEYRYGSKMRFSCPNSDYVLSGNHFVSCDEHGNWTGSAPKCLAPCYVKITKNLKSKRMVYKNGTTAELSCEDGFLLTGMIDNKMPQCHNGKWILESSRFPYCDNQEEAEKWTEKFWKKFKNSG